MTQEPVRKTENICAFLGVSKTKFQTVLRDEMLRKKVLWYQRERTRRVLCAYEQDLREFVRERGGV